MIDGVKGEGPSMDHFDARARYTCRGYVAERSDVFRWQGRGRWPGHRVVDVIGVDVVVRGFVGSVESSKSPEFLEFCERTVFFLLSS